MVVVMDKIMVFVHNIMVESMVDTWFDWSKELDKGGSSVITSIEPVSRSPVLLFFMNSFLYFCTMENPSPVDSFN